MVSGETTTVAKYPDPKEEVTQKSDELPPLETRITQV